MNDRDKDQIERAIRHIQSSLDVDPWACEIAVEAMKKQLPSAQPEQQWVPVTERLPEDDTVVLVCGKNGGVYTAIHNNSKTWIRGWWKLNSKNHRCHPVAWMPLPESYRGEKDV